MFLTLYIEKTSGCLPEIEGNPENKTNDIANVQLLEMQNMPQYFKY